MCAIMARLAAAAPKLIAKGIGLTTLGIVCYDSHVVGKLQAEVSAKSRDADAACDYFRGTQYLDSPSTTKAKVTKGIFNLELQQNWRSFWNSSAGYAKGFGAMIVSNVIPFALGLGTLLSKSTAGSWIGATASMLYGMYVIGKDVFGIGRHNELNSKF